MAEVGGFWSMSSARARSRLRWQSELRSRRDRACLPSAAVTSPCNKVGGDKGVLHIDAAFNTPARILNVGRPVSEVHKFDSRIFLSLRQVSRGRTAESEFLVGCG